MMLAVVVRIGPEGWGALAVAVVVALVGWLGDRRPKRIEVLVNGRIENLMRRTTQLEATLQAHGHPIPPDPALHVVPVPAKE